MFLKVDRPDDGLTNKPKHVAATLQFVVCYGVVAVVMVGLHGGMGESVEVRLKLCVRACVRVLRFEKSAAYFLKFSTNFNCTGCV